MLRAMLIATLSMTSLAAQTLPAFPGAMGGGAASVGGRGGTICEVTNLNDSGAGSLRSCVQPATCAPRIVTFRIAGVIAAQSRLQASCPNLTVAGQTAPGEVVLGGPTQKGEQFFISTHDVVVQYVTYDGNNPNTATGPDTGTIGFELASGNVYNVVICNTSNRWVGNKNIAILSNDAGNIHGVTICKNLIYEPNSQHPVGVGTDATSGSAKATTDIDFYGNVFITTDHRIPLVQGANHVRWVNNTNFNWNQFAFLSMGGLQVDDIGNQDYDGNISQDAVHPFIANPNGADPGDPTDNCSGGGTPCDNATNPTFYRKNNLARAGTQPNGPTCVSQGVNDSCQLSQTSTGWEGGSAPCPGCTTQIGVALPSSVWRSTPLPTEQFPIVAVDQSLVDATYVYTSGNSQRLACDGTWIASSDSNDLRVLGQYKVKGPGQLFTGQFSTPPIPAGTPCPEDPVNHLWLAYEQKNNIAAGTPSNTVAANGYTIAENMINGTGSPAPPPPPTGVSGWLGADALTGTIAIGKTVTVNSNAGPVRSGSCSTSAPVSPQPNPLVGASVTVIGGPAPPCSNGVIYWQVQFGGTPPPNPPTVTGVTVSCPSTLQTGASGTCTAQVTGTGNYNTAVTWAASLGSISATGVFTAPATAGTSIVTATSVGDTTKSAKASITVTAPAPPASCPSPFSVNLVCTYNPATNSYSCVVKP